MPGTETKLLGLKESILREISHLKAVSLKESFENYFNNECALNDYLQGPLVNEVVFKALERCLCRVKGYQKIDADFPDSLISEGGVGFICPQLEKIRLKLADLYADILADNTSKEIDAKNIYAEIKDFFYVVYQSDDSDKVSFLKKLGILDLLLNLLARKNGVTLEKFHKEFTPLFIFIKSLITKQKNLAILLDYLNNLGTELNEVKYYSNEDILAIKKGFYSIVHALDKDKKIIDKHLLIKLTKLVNEQYNDPLKKFSIIFIEKCLNDADMDHSDFELVIALVHSALKNSNSKSLKIVQNSKFFSKFNQAIGKKPLNYSLKEFEEAFKKLSKQTTPGEVLNFTPTEENLSISTERERFIASYFPAEKNIKQVKVKENFYQSLEAMNLTNETEKKSSANYLIKTTEKFKTISDLSSETLGKVKKNITRASENLSEIFSIAAENFKEKYDENSLNEVKDVSQYLEGEKINLNSLKVKLSDFIETLEILENKIYFFIANISVTEGVNINRTNVNSFDLEDKGIYKKVDECIKSFKDNYFNLIQELLSLLIGGVKRENDWFDVNHKVSLAERLFNRGYLSSDSLIKKLKSKLDKNMNFIQYKNFFKEKSFWNLLSYGIIRWPWVNKEIFSIKWAEQLCLPTVLDLKEQLLNFPLMPEEDSLEKILSLSKYINSDKILLFEQQLMRLKQNIIMYKSKIKALDKEIDTPEKQAKEVSCSAKLDFIEADFFSPPSLQSSSKERTESLIPNFARDLSHIFTM